MIPIANKKETIGPRRTVQTPHEGYFLLCFYILKDYQKSNGKNSVKTSNNPLIKAIVRYFEEKGYDLKMLA